MPLATWFGAYDVTVRRLKRALLVVSAIIAGLLYVWVAAVRAVPGVRRRRADRRAVRLRRGA
jgi:hypothetical protein